ncbi:spore cortex biosynthesis protein YabQ [Virgibacillus sp. 179-BFC.A HS]|uniref:Spore cortex biosynthesis protein YabQ n=1 Tax=Tigheibacillus jepli TaxID=3035914 RepID=A0ABU5CET9_9BACI|nr:spore cortex biosynthesis protein YabQ [Virgibacillus sp. 179-BFC.A HS]MDY0404035.1 spore cortex biosynthesis protein YabQ [Virgibacillus sp. 179-BFC.A HS]
MMLNIQLMTMIAMIASGIYLGAVRDTYKRFAVHWKNRTVFNYVMEISFWLLQTFIIYYVLYLVNFGELRVYIFLACLLGFAMYQALFAKGYRKLLEMLITCIKAICKFIFQVVRTFIYLPIRFILQTLIVCLLFIGKILYTIIRFCLKVVWFPVGWLAKLLYRLLPDKIKKIFPKFAGVYSRIKNIYNKIRSFITTRKRR